MTQNRKFDMFDNWSTNIGQYNQWVEVETMDINRWVDVDLTQIIT